MKPIIGYVRVSTEDQAQEGVSLDAQREKIRMWAALYDHELVGIHEDAGISGKRMDNRPGFQGALRDVCRHKGILVVYSLSRAGRNTRELLELAEQLQKCGADFVSLTEHIETHTATGRMFFTLMAALAQFERDQTSERTISALAHKRKNGERTGNIPYGKRLAADGVHLEDCPVEKGTMSYIRELRELGYSYQQIADDLAENEIPNRNGSLKWRTATIMKICKEGA